MENKTAYTPSEGELEIIKTINNEKTNWEEGEVCVTDNANYVMKNVVKKARKNYLGFFVQPNDPQTDQPKVFVPFTEWVVENFLKNVDIDTKDITVKATNGSELAYLKAHFFRHILKKKLNDINFGKTLNKLLRRIAIDGTGFLKSYLQDKKLNIDVADRLNMLYDPTLEDIEKSSGKTERYVLTKPEFYALKLKNYEYVKGSKTVDRTNLNGIGEETTEVPYVEAFERYGWFAKICLTDSEEDRDTYFYGRAIVSGGSQKEMVVHLIEEVDKDDCPYGAFKLKEVPNRADGRGIGEMLFSIQAYLNEIVNNRLKAGRISSMNLFHLTGNITPQQFKKLFTTGAIKTDSNSTVQLLDTGSIDQASYNDEESAYKWGMRVTGTTQEDDQAANRPATNALIEQQGASKGFNLRIEDMMLDLSAYMNRIVVPLIKKELKANPQEFLRITADSSELKKLDNILVQSKVAEKMLEAYERTEIDFEDEEATEQAYIEETMQELRNMGSDRFVPLIDEILDTEYDVAIVITDETINKATMATMLQGLINMLAPLGLPIKKTLTELYDTLGLDGDMLVEETPDVAPVPMAGVPQEATTPGLPMPAPIANQTNATM
jgi:hypothetical protein